MNFLWPFYYIAIQLYKLSIKAVSPFNRKAHMWLYGRRALVSKWSKLKNIQEPRIWIHCASLGEFEQGKPLMIALKEAYPGHKIVLTFFSPSGYEVRKNTPVADYVFYMPLDGPSASRRFVKAINPKMVFFVKYEFWYFYGRYLAKKKIPFFCVSAIFRPDQVFFKWYGGFFKQMLHRFNHLFVQDQDSLKLLYKNAIAKVTVAGDTRFDAVYKIANENKGISIIEEFKSDKKLVVVGSSWEADMLLINDWIRHAASNFKFIIAPHEVNSNTISKIENQWKDQVVKFSEFAETKKSEKRILIIDSVGFLSQVYKYADYTYVGGGFGVGIHNILEAAVYGMPIFIGPNYHKFKEAVELVKLKGVFSVSDSNELINQFDKLNADPIIYQEVGAINKNFVNDRKGATKIIVDYLKLNNLS